MVEINKSFSVPTASHNNQSDPSRAELSDGRLRHRNVHGCNGRKRMYSSCESPKWAQQLTRFVILTAPVAFANNGTNLRIPALAPNFEQTIYCEQDLKLISNCYSALTACQAEVVANSEKAAYLQGRFDGRVDVSCKNHIDEKRYLNVTLQQLQNTSSQLKADNKVLQSKLTTLRTELKNTANNEASLRTELENALEQIAQNEADQSLVATLSAELENTITQEQAAAGGSLLGFLSIFGTAGFFKREQICRMISSCCSWLCSGRQQDSTESVANQQAIEEGVPLQAVGTVDESGSRSYSEVTRPHRSTMSRA